MANHVSVRRDRFRDLINRLPKKQRLLARAFWIEALMRANWRDGDIATDRDILQLKRGQFPMGRAEMATELGCTERELRTVIGRLEKLQELTSKSSNRGTILTVVKYDDYVDDQPKTDQQNAQQTPNKRPTSDQQATTHEETKASKETKASEDLKPTPSTGGGNSSTEEAPDIEDPKPIECEVCEETRLLATQIHRKLSFELAPLQGFHLTRLEFYRSRMSDNDILSEVLGASSWIANKNRSWDGVLSIVKKRVDNPPKHESNGIHASPDPPEGLCASEQAFEDSYQRISNRIENELAIKVGHMGKPGHRGGMSLYGARDGDLTEQARRICNEEGLPTLYLEVF